MTNLLQTQGFKNSLAIGEWDAFPGNPAQGSVAFSGLQASPSVPKLLLIALPEVSKIPVVCTAVIQDSVGSNAK